MSEWLIATLFFLAFAVIFSFALWSIESTVPTVRRYFWCPMKGTTVAVELIYHLATNRNVDVKSCSFFGEDKKVICSKKCLEMDPDQMAPNRF